MKNYQLNKKATGRYEAQTKYIKEAYINKTSSGWRLMSDNPHVYETFSYFRDAKSFLNDFDTLFERQLNQEKLKKLKEDKIESWREELTKSLNKQVNLEPHQHCVFAKKLKVGDMVDVMFGLGKENSIGEILFQIQYDSEYCEKYNEIEDPIDYRNLEPIQRSHTLVEIENIIDISNQEYDFFVNNLLTRFDGSFSSLLDYRGGNTSDYHNPEQMKDDYFDYLEEANKPEYSPRSLGTLVTSQNRVSIVVDPQGYDYARYVGFCCSNYGRYYNERS